MDRRQHWESVYGTKSATEVSWYRPHLETSRALIESCARSKEAAILDIGGGASTLVDDLLASGFRDISVLDISRGALDVARQRLGSAGSAVHWLAEDFLHADLEPLRYDVCHDRAVFHFLGDEGERKSYFKQLERILRPEGSLILATFALEGPPRCSGLDVTRYGEAKMKEAAGAAFELVSSQRESHRTPTGSVQEMMYFVMRRSTSSPAAA
ncbi:MAG TPA: class I SAM-dependent methyltransferase [Edaphobacter sp.]|nr:class I SAM-dependent methyltransferase [Edaphobacter sp.]